MQTLAVNDIMRAVKGEIISKKTDTAAIEFRGVVTDSRKAGEGVLFVPLIGEKEDGHNYIKSALEHGASAVLTQKNTDRADGTVIKVADTRKALGDIARYYKKKYPVPSVAVTGSVGKTTTRDLTYAVLNEHYNAHKTQGNFNNDIGLPLTIFGIEKKHEMAVLEMGMNHFGEISYLASIVCPEAAIITNIGMSHIENLGSQEGIFKAKMEITENFTSENTLIVNGDDKFLKTVCGDYEVIKYGLGQSNDVYAKNIENNGMNGMKFTVSCFGEEFEAEITRPGVHNVYNALAAVCAGKHFGVSTQECIKGLKNCVYTEQRLEITEHNGIELINDCYCSSPDSLRAALKVQQNSEKSRKIAILGDILELGSFAAKAHYELGTDVARCGIDMLVCAGENAAELARGAMEAGMANIRVYTSSEEIARDADVLVHSGDSVLVKASHSMQFNKIAEAIESLPPEEL